MFFLLSRQSSLPAETPKTVLRIRIRINFQMTSQNVWNMNLFEHFFTGLSLYLDARIWIPIRIRIASPWKVGSGSTSASNKNPDPDPHQIKIRIRIGIRVIGRIRIRINVMRIHNTARKQGFLPRAVRYGNCSESAFFFRGTGFETWVWRNTDGFKINYVIPLRNSISIPVLGCTELCFMEHLFSQYLLIAVKISQPCYSCRYRNGYWSLSLSPLF